MKVLKIDKEEWSKGLGKLRENYRLFATVESKNSHDFQELKKGELPDLDFGNTRLSPKAVVFPQSEVMFRYTLDEENEDHHILKEPNTNYSPRAVLGIRPCDAASFLVVQRNFDSSAYRDPYWIKSYETATMVGLACETPSSTCFCSSTGHGPYNEEGLDLLLMENDGGFLAKVITSKGEKLVKTADWSAEIEAADLETRKKQAEARINSFIDTERLKEIKTTDLFSADFWEDTAFACLNCGTCTYSCPTCWCFDIQDEVQDDAGKRIRIWDSCMYPLFTLEGSGHNPRPEKMQRVRQRFMHKFKYYLEKYDEGVQCVGCGRCIRLCPVNIDIRLVCDKMNSFQSSPDTPKAQPDTKEISTCKIRICLIRFESTK